MDELHDLVGAYALDALDDEERRQFEAHLETCERCRTELAELEAGALALAESTRSDPPPELRARVLEAVERKPQEAVVIDLAARRRNRLVTAALGVAALIVTVITTISIVEATRDGDIEAILTAPDVQTIELTGESADARFTYSLGVGRGVFVSGSLAAPGPEQTYQLWLIGSDGPQPAGLFIPDTEGVSSAVVNGVRAGLTLGVTEEPAGGSDAPTGDVLMAGEV